MSFAKLARYWHTLRYLKPVQWYGRVWFRLYRPKAGAMAVSPIRRSAIGHWQPPIARAPSMLGPCRFSFLNHEHSLPPTGGWNDTSQEKLWLYNLHYFDDLSVRYADARSEWQQALLLRWIAENPPGTGNAWEPYPTSLRIVNWVKWLAAGNPPVAGMTQSLAVQADWLRKKLERHLLGNHLFVNGKALVFAGLYCDGQQAGYWLTTGLAIIARELPEQVLADGGNFERSPMYHAIFLEDVLDLINAAAYWPGQVPAQQVAAWREVAGRMLNWLRGMTHPDGEIGLFNDAAFGVAPNVASLLKFGQRLGIGNATVPQPLPGMLHLAESGYVRLEQGPALALLDVAPVGPDYLPGHAHADTLSFELSVYGQRVVVNGGTSRYGLGSERLRERGSAAHSTVQVAGADSSEVWGGFRVARRARPFDLVTREHAGSLFVACSHDGYRRLAGKPIHRREWRLDDSGMLVADSVSGGNHGAVARFILHPQVAAEPRGNGVWQLTLPGGQALRVTVLTGTARLEQARYAPEFGKSLPTHCLAVDLVAGQALTHLRWD